MSKTPTRLHSPGPYLAEIVNHLDRTYMGGLEVILKTRTPAMPNFKPNTYRVRYMTPFYGVTSYRFLGNDSANYEDTQKSYGMWMVPPDVGTTVMVIFVDSDPNQGYWIGCIPDPYMNHMMPGIAASNSVRRTKRSTDPGIFDKAEAFPVAEINLKTFDKSKDIETEARPMHRPFAEALGSQGLLLDDIRGITSSSARREAPSHVFGISTPGQTGSTNGATPGAGNPQKIGFDGTARFATNIVGGQSFVMDDGDITGKNELIRLRTRTGAQLLLNVTEDVIYLANSKGTAWLEFTSDGKIEIYARDSVSIHTEGDFNFKAARDFNFHAGNTFNLYSEGDVNINSLQNINSLANKVLIQTTGDGDVPGSGDYVLAVAGNKLVAVDQDSIDHTLGKATISANEDIAIQAINEVSVYGGKQISLDSVFTKQAPGVRIAKADPVGTIDVPEPIPLFLVPTTPSFEKDAVDEPELAAMQRVPQHEPWTQHENLDRPAFSRKNTNIRNTGTQVTFKTGPVLAQGNQRISGVDSGTVGRVLTPWSTDKPFLNKVKTVSAALGLKPVDLLAVMNFETGGTFDPAKKNTSSPENTATGLIQFVEKSGAKDVGKTTAELRNMSRVEQMDYVEKYFRRWNWPNSNVKSPTVANVYLTVLYPDARFYNPDDVVLDKDSPKEQNRKDYESNKSLDVKDPTTKELTGKITVAMITKKIISAKARTLEVLKAQNLDENLDPKK